MIKAYMLLVISIVCEVIGTSMLPATKGFTVLKPTFIVVVVYIICFTAFGKCLMDLNLGIAWATWGAVGTLVMPVAGYFFYHQKLTKAGVLGIILIVASTVTLNIFG